MRCGLAAVGASLSDRMIEVATSCLYSLFNSRGVRLHLCAVTRPCVSCRRRGKFPVWAKVLRDNGRASRDILEVWEDTACLVETDGRELDG